MKLSLVNKGIKGINSQDRCLCIKKYVSLTIANKLLQACAKFLGLLRFIIATIKKDYIRPAPNASFYDISSERN